MTAPAITMQKPRRTMGYQKLLESVLNWPEYRLNYKSVKQLVFEGRVVPVSPNELGALAPHWGYKVILRRRFTQWQVRTQTGVQGYFGFDYNRKVPPEALDQVEFALSEFMVKLQTLTGPLDERF